VRAYRIAYDGQPYHGFQRQPDVRTVEGELLSALDALDVTGGDPPSGYAAAGRTDAGVSAVAQTVAFDAPDWLSPAAFNSELPPSIRAWASADVPPDFHATHHATGREYTYFLHAGDASESLARRALDALSGQQDFHNLTPDESGTRRDLSTTLDCDDQFFVLRFRASGFPRQFVRRGVAVVADVARERREPGYVDRVLSDESLSGPDGVGPAPAAPLVLTAVSYPDIRFIEDGDAASRTRGLFDDLRVERAAGARVAGVLARGSEDSDSR